MQQLNNEIMKQWNNVEIPPPASQKTLNLSPLIKGTGSNFDDCTL